MAADNQIDQAKVKADGIDSVYIRQIMKDMKNGVMAIDRQGTILYINPQMASFFESSELVGTSIHSLILENEHTSNDGFWDAILDTTYQHTIHNQKKVCFVSPSGIRRSLHVTSSYLSSETGEGVKGVVISVSDETDYDLTVQKKKESTIVLIGMLMLVCLTVLISELHTFLNGAFPHDWIARSTELLGFVFLAIVLKFTSLTVKDFGLIPGNVKKELLEAFLVIAVMVSVMSVAKVIMLAGGSTFFLAEAPFFDFSAPPRFYYVKYVGIVFLQEVLTKCGLQKSVSKILDNKHGSRIAIVITSLMFMALHLQHGLIYMLGAGILSAVLAILYNRHNSLLGSCLVHYAFGIMGLVLQWID